MLLSSNALLVANHGGGLHQYQVALSEFRGPTLEICGVGIKDVETSLKPIENLS